MSQTEPEAADQVLQWVMLLQGHEDEYGGQLSLTDFDTFQAQLADIASVLRDDPARAAECRTNLIELVSRYPSVGQWLVGVDPAYRDLPGVNEPLAVEPEADAAEPEVTPAEPAVAEPVVTTRSVPAVEVAALAVAAPDPGPGDPAREQAVPPAAPSRRSRRESRQEPRQEPQPAKKTPSPESTAVRPRFWTPDVVMQAGKEVVTALIGLIIIGSTIALVARSFGLIGNAKHINQAKDLLSIMLGLVGTVIGYYFGRVPADARATTATARADQATAEKEKVKARARSLADNLDGIMSPTSTTSMALPRGSVDPNQDRLRAIRDSLRDLSSS